MRMLLSFAAILGLFLLPNSQVNSQELVNLGKDPVWVTTQSGAVATWSPDSPTTIELRDEHSLLVTQSLDVPPKTLLHAMAVLSSGDLVAITSRNSLLRWKMGSRQAVEQALATDDLSAPCGFLTEGRIAYGNTAKGCEFWDTSDGQTIAEVGCPMGDNLKSVHAMTDSSKMLIVFEYHFGWVDLAAPKQPAFIELKGPIQAVLASPSNRFIAALSDDRIELADMVQETHEYVDRKVSNDVAFCGKDDEYLLVGRGRSSDFGVDVWSIGGGLPSLSFARSLETRIGGAISSVPGSSDLIYVTKSSRGKCLTRDSLISGDGYSFGPIIDHWSDHQEKLVTHMAVSASGNSLVCVTGDAVVSVWDMHSPVHYHMSSRHSAKSRTSDTSQMPTITRQVNLSGTVVDVDVSANEHWVAIRMLSGEVFALELGAGLRTATVRCIDLNRYSDGDFTSGTSIEDLDISPTKRVLAICTDRGMSLVRPQTGEELWYASDKYRAPRFSRDGTKMLFCSSQYTYNLNLLNGKTVQLSSWGSAELGSWDERLGVDLFLDHKIAVIDPSMGAVLAYLKPDYVNSRGQTDISSDHRFVATLAAKREGSGYGLQVFEARSGRSVGAIPIDLDGFRSVRFIGDNSLIAVGDGRQVKIYDYRKNRVVQKLRDRPRQKSDSQGSYSATGVVAGGWANEVSSGVSDNIASFNQMDYNLATHRIALAGQESVGLWDAESGDCIWNMPFQGGLCTALQFSVTGGELCVGTKEGFVYIFTLPKSLIMNDVSAK
ncbi:MAG: WD40 repeat domain-containing protein [Pirellulaceae bacterium]